MPDDSIVISNDASTAAPWAAEVGRYDAFISYARKDKVMAERVRSALGQRGKTVWVDVENIAVGADWQDRITRGIEACKAFIFLLSPASAVSEACRRELEQAHALNKLIIPVYCREVSRSELPPTVTDRQWVFLRETDSWLDGIDKLVEGLETDLEWRDHHTRLAGWAREWLDAGRDNSFLLRGSGLRDAETWLARQTDHRERATAEQSELIVKSRRAATMRQRILIAGVSAGLLIAVILAVVALVQRNRAVEQANVATSRQLAAESVNERDQRLDRSLLLALAALDFDTSAEAQSALVGAIEHLPGLKGYLHGTEGSAGTVAFDPTGTLIAAGDGPAVRLWDAADGQPVGPPLLEHGAPVMASAFAQATTLATASEDGQLVLWDVVARRPIQTWELGEMHPTTVTFDASLSLAAITTNEQGLLIFDLRHDRVDHVVSPPPDDTIVSATFSRDGQTLAFGTDIGAIGFWDAAARAVLDLQIEIPIGDYSQSVGTLAFSPDGTMLASGSPGGIVNLWDVASGESLGWFGETSGDRGPVSAIAFTGNGHTLIAGHEDRQVNAWSVDGSFLLESWPGHGPVEALAVSPDGSELAIASSEGPVVRYSLLSPEWSRMARGLGQGGASAGTYGVTWSPGGDILAAATLDTVHFYDADTGEERGTISWDGGFFDALEFSPDGSLLATILSEYVHASNRFSAKIVIWDVASRSLITESLRADDDIVQSISFSHDGRLLAVGDEHGTVELWDPARGMRHGAALRAEGAPVNVVAFSPDGQDLAIGDAAGALELWNVKDGTRRNVALRDHGSPVRTIAFTADGTRLVSGAMDGIVEIWDAATGQREGEPLADLQGPIVGLAVSHDSRRVAVAGGRSDTISLWDFESRRLLTRPATGHPDGFTSVAFSPDDQYLAWGIFSIPPRTLLVRWDASLEAWRAHACSLARRELTAEEWNRYVGAQRQDQVRLCRDAALAASNGQ